MICAFEITKKQLLEALKWLNECEERGFTESTAVFCITSVNPDGTDVMASFDNSVMLKAHPTDKSKNWGRCNVNHIGWW